MASSRSLMIPPPSRYVHDVVSWSEDGSNLTDPYMLKALLSPYSLQVRGRVPEGKKYSASLLALHDISALLVSVHDQVRVSDVVSFRAASKAMDLSRKMAIKVRCERGSCSIGHNHNALLLHRVGRSSVLCNFEPKDIEVHSSDVGKEVSFRVDETVRCTLCGS